MFAKKIWDIIISTIVGAMVFGALSFIQAKYPAIVAIFITALWSSLFEVRLQRRGSKKLSIGNSKKTEETN